jgi:hypothetical protein
MKEESIKLHQYLEKYGIGTLEDAKQLCLDKGIDRYNKS